MAISINDELNHLYRSESGKMVSVLTRIFGSHHLSLAEDVVQESFEKALQHWTKNKTPENPSAWLMLTAKRKAINILRRDRHVSAFAQDIDPLLKSEWSLAATVEEVFLDTEINDSQLRMMFTCCHPELSSKSQLALTLKSLCGFKTVEIARALLSTEDTIRKTLYRAKQKIKLKEIKFIVPSGQALDARLQAVHLTIYLLFNEGYNSSLDQKLIRRDLCYEAMRLANLLATQIKHGQSQSYALLALLCFHTARLNARIDDHGCILILEEQDRSIWDKSLISRGLDFLHQASKSDQLSAYHIEAGIAALHCTTSNFEETNWKQIYDWYDLLDRLKPSPIIKLNQAIILGKIHGAQHAIERLTVLTHEPQLKNYYLLYASLGAFYSELGMHNEAINQFQTAIKLTNSEKEKQLLVRKINLVQSG